ncbi:hypothetical protein LG288_03840 [Idiomarina seosinensis]|uniref:hypothetical protein n=1 Tax=Idiomarina seosinensis TaxID=281739 RepID=UPI0038516781
MRLLAGLIVLLLGACAHDPQQLLRQADALQQQQHRQLAQQYAYQALPSPTATIVHSEDFYVPQINPDLLAKPAWFSRRVKADMRGVPLLKALQQLLSPLGVSIYLADEVDAGQLVYTDQDSRVGDVLNWIANAQQLIIEPYAARVEVKQLAVRQFDVSFLAGDTRFLLGEDNNRSGLAAAGQTPGGLANGSSQYLNFASQQLSLWSDLERSLQLMLSQQGELAINQSSTSVVVKDTPTVIAAVEDYIADLNTSLTRQVAIDVQVIEISFNDHQQYAVDWQLLRNMQGGGPFSALSAGNGTVTGAPLQFSLQKTSGRFAGSQVFIDALREQGQVRVSHHPRVMTLNNQIARLLVEDETTYLASSGSTSTPNVGTEQLLLPGKVTTGFELFLLPKVQKQQVILQLSSSLSALQGIDSVSSGEQLIQTPRTSRKTFFLKAMVGHQQTLLLSGLQHSRTETGERKGLLSWIAGGQTKQSMANSETLLLLTPSIAGEAI